MWAIGAWKYLDRAVDKTGQASAFLLTEERDEPAAPRFRTKAIERHGVPAKSTIAGSEATAAAIRGDNEAHGTAILIRQVHYVNHVVAQAQRAVKCVTRPMLGFKAVEAAQGTLAGLELMPMRKNGPMVVAKGAERLPPAEPFDALAA